MDSTTDKSDDLPDVSALSIGMSKKTAASKQSKKIEVADSWEDELDDEEPAEAEPEPAEVDSDHSLEAERTNQASNTTTDTSYLGGASAFYSSTADEATSSGRRERPATTMMVANRLIASGIGQRIKLTEEQRKADKEKFEQEKKRRDEERKKKAEAEVAKKAIWEDS
jgi:hypothetical protein